MPNEEKEKDKIIDLPSDGPGAEVTLPEEPVKEGAQDVAVPEVKPEGEVEVKKKHLKKKQKLKNLYKKTSLKKKQKQKN